MLLLCKRVGLVDTNIQTLNRIKAELKTYNTPFTPGPPVRLMPIIQQMFPFLIPILILCFVLCLAPVLIKFLRAKVQEITRVTFNQMLLHPCVQIPTIDPNLNDVP